MQSGSLKFEQVSKEYTGQFVINSISLQFNPGEITLLIGANGSGKSTLLRIAAGLVTPNSGAVERAQDIVGYLGHRTSLYLHLTVAENLEFWSRLLNPSSESNPSEIDVLMKQWNLTQYRNRFVNELSKGVQTRLGLARAFSGDPKTILLDEPTSSLDEESVTTLSELLKQRAHSGAVIVIASHDLARLLPITSRIILLKDGTIYKDERCSERERVDSVLAQYQKANR